MRLNQYLARAGVAARRKADALIASGEVAVNGVPARPGQQVRPGVDRVSVAGRDVHPVVTHTYLLLNKPAGILTTVADDRGRPTVLDAVPASPARLFPVGRLDLPSRGLVLLTDDGDLAVRLMHPRYHVEKEYRVVVKGRPDGRDLERLREGVRVGTERFAPAEVEERAGDDRQSRLTVVLREGRKREVRRMFRALGHPVLDLERVRIGPLVLGRLPSGEVRSLTGEEVVQLRRAVSLEP